jgi:hypothetical protein
MTTATANLPSAHQVIENNQSMDLLRTTYRTELDVLMEQAKMYPRDMIERIDQAKIIACSSVDIAEACFYKKPAGRDEDIQGPSVRLAEIIAMCWGNMMVDVRTQMITETEVICRGMGMDCQTGFGVSVETRIGILYSDRHDTKAGQRYPEHLITTTALAGCSIAYRNTVFRLVPAALVQPVYLAVKAAAIGEGDEFEKRRTDVINRLQRNLDVSTARILISVGAEEIEQITPKQLETLIGYGTAIHNGDVLLEEVFPPPGASASAQLTDQLKQSVPTGGNQSGEAPAKGEQGTVPPASSEAPPETPKPNIHPDAAEMLKGTDPNSKFEQIKPSPPLLDETPPQGPGKPILDQMIDWFRDRAGNITSHDAFTRLQNYAKSHIGTDANIQTMSDRAINAFWMHLKKVEPKIVN